MSNDYFVTSTIEDMIDFLYKELDSYSNHYLKHASKIEVKFIFNDTHIKFTTPVIKLETGYAIDRKILEGFRHIKSL